VLAPPARPVEPELCRRADPARRFDAHESLVRAVLPVLGATPIGPPPTPTPVEALRLYAEARQAVRAGEWAEAVRLVEETLREDPRFLSARILQERLSLSRSQFMIDGLSDAMPGPAFALDRLRAEVARKPESIDARVALGRLLVSLELLDEAVRVLSPLLSTPGAPAEAFGLLAHALAASGEVSRGYQAVLEYRRRATDEPTGYSLMAEPLTAWGDLERAAQNLDLARQSRQRHGQAVVTFEDLVGRWRIHALRGDWAHADRVAAEMMSLDDPRAAGLATLHLARRYLFEGRSRLAGVLAEEAAFRFVQSGGEGAEAIATAVEVRLARDDAPGALELIREASAGGRRPLDRRVAFWEPIALARAGRWAEAERARQRLVERLDRIPGPSGRRLASRLEGELSLHRGDAPRAVSSLSEAARLLPPGGFCGDHVPTWYASARAHLAAVTLDERTRGSRRSPMPVGSGSAGPRPTPARSRCSDAAGGRRPPGGGRPTSITSTCGERRPGRSRPGRGPTVRPRSDEHRSSRCDGVGATGSTSAVRPLTSLSAGGHETGRPRRGSAAG
jgi:tetratricopeptide (TPR) repeat protein